MFDTMTMTKITGGLFGAFLIFLLGGFFSEFIYEEGEGAGEERPQAYTIATADDAEDGQANEEVATEMPFGEIYASADASAGEKLFRQCQACHSVEPGKNATGPSLYGVVGRPVDSEDGYSYSGALEKVADQWTPENLSGFLADPKGYAPGTKMSFRGLKDVMDRANLIAWLESLDN